MENARYECLQRITCILPRKKHCFGWMKVNKFENQFRMNMLFMASYLDKMRQIGIGIERNFAAISSKFHWKNMFLQMSLNLSLLVFYVTCNDISVIYVQAQMCRRTEEVMYLQKIKEYMNSCPKCQSMSKIEKTEVLQPILVASIWYQFGIDLVTMLKCKQGNQYILTLVYYISKWSEDDVPRERFHKNLSLKKSTKLK